MRTCWATCLLIVSSLAGSAADYRQLTDAKTQLLLEMPDEALRILKDFRERHREVPATTFLLLSEAYQQKGDSAAALDACQEGERHFQDNLEIIRCIAERMVDRNPTLVGVEYYLKRLEERIDWRNGSANELYARWACANGKDDVCIERASLALGIGLRIDKSIRLHALMAKAHARRGELREAELEFLASLRENREMYERAMEAAQKPTILPAGARIRTNGVWIDFLPEPAMDFVHFLEAQHRESDAEELNTEILGIEPNFAPALLFAARKHAGRGQLAEAARSAEAALDHAGDDEALVNAIRAALSEIYSRLGRPREALEIPRGPRS